MSKQGRYDGGRTAAVLYLMGFSYYAGAVGMHRDAAGWYRRLVSETARIWRDASEEKTA